MKYKIDSKGRRHYYDKESLTEIKDGVGGIHKGILRHNDLCRCEGCPYSATDIHGNSACYMDEFTECDHSTKSKES